MVIAGPWQFIESATNLRAVGVGELLARSEAEFSEGGCIG
jgi:hypothetical protein